jgi:hypothetical protein
VTRSAYGLDVPRSDEIDWRREAPCRETPDLWFPESPGRAAYPVHVCLNHCPVIDRCRQDIAEWSPRACVQAGVFFNDSSKQPGPHSYQPRSMPCGSLCGVEEPPKPPRKERPWFQPCGTPAARRRHWERGEQPCQPCLEAERARDRERMRRRRTGQ